MATVLERLGDGIWKLAQRSEERPSPRSIVEDTTGMWWSFWSAASWAAGCCRRSSKEASIRRKVAKWTSPISIVSCFMHMMVRLVSNIFCKPEMSTAFWRHPSRIAQHPVRCLQKLECRHTAHSCWILGACGSNGNF